jgi:hypothetical protein
MRLNVTVLELGMRRWVGSKGHTVQADGLRRRVSCEGRVCPLHYGVHARHSVILL